jgi:hypothetical protein
MSMLGEGLQVSVVDFGYWEAWGAIMHLTVTILSLGTQEPLPVF